MKTSLSRLLVLVSVLALTEPAAFAAKESRESSLSVESNRVKNRLGGYLAVAEPAPGVLGLNVAYNITDFLRASAGYGKISVGIGAAEASASTFGFGIRGMVPGWNITPSIGLHYGHVSYSGTGILDAGGFTESGGHVYGTLGFDWQADNGFNCAGGLRYSFKSGVGAGLYLSAGWFVNWLG